MWQQRDGYEEREVNERTKYRRGDGGKDYLCPSTDVLDPSYGGEHFLDTPPDAVVYVPVLISGPMTFVLAKAFRSEKAALTHWWFRERPWRDDEREPMFLRRMTMATFIRTTETEGMNPFVTMARIKNLSEYKRKHGLFTDKEISEGLLLATKLFGSKEK